MADDRYMNRREQMFPRLTPAQIDRIAALAQRRTVAAGEVLFERGDQDLDFYVVLEGSLEIVRPRGTLEERITVHGPGEFTGELSMLSSQRALVRGRMLQGAGATSKPACPKRARSSTSS